jgi:hypothetical protein
MDNKAMSDLIVETNDHPMDYPTIPAHMDPMSHDSEAEREHLRREVELLLMQAEQLDEFGSGEFADDSTVTNIADELQGLGM